MNSSSARLFAKIVGALLVLSLFLGLLFPCTNCPTGDRAWKTYVATDSRQIIAAIEAYHSEYGHYPFGASGAPEGVASLTFIYGQASTAPGIGSGVSNSQLFDILRNIDSTSATPPGQPNRYNPKGIVFYDAKTANDANHPRAGFIPPNVKPPLHSGALVDPWGTEYFIAISSGPEPHLTILPYKDFQNDHAPGVSVGVFSLGKDRQLGAKGDSYYKKPNANSPSDDIISWQ